MEEALAVTFILEMPHDLGLPESFSIGTIDSRPSGLESWSTQDLARFATVQGDLPPDTGPGTRMVFRRRSVRTAVPLEAADQAFRDWLAPILSETELERREADLAHYLEEGLTHPLTVVGLSRFVAASSVPDEGLESWLHEQLEVALNDLNTLLATLGLVTGDWRIGPIAADQLPGLVPVILESSHGTEDQRSGTTITLELHNQVPNLADQQLDPERIEAALGLWTAANHGEQPFFPAFQLFFEAGRFGAGGRRRESILILATAIELLVSTTLGEVGTRRGSSDEEIERARNDPPRTRVRKHLARALGIAIDLEADGDPFGRWWQTGYALRNRVVHEGARPSRAELEAAWAGAEEMLAGLKSALAGDQVTADLADALLIRLKHPSVGGD
jgi:hypothetical protein